MGSPLAMLEDRGGLLDKATETLLKLRNDPVLFVEKVLNATPEVAEEGIKGHTKK